MRSLQAILIVAFVAMVAPIASATDFRVNYGFPHWTFVSGGAGDSFATNTPALGQLQITGSTDGGTTTYYVTILGTDTITFNWSFSNPQLGLDNYAAWQLNSDAPQVFASAPAGSNGTEGPIAVGASDVFKFLVFNDSGEGPSAVLTITDLLIPVTVPEPASLALIGLAGAVMFRRTRRSA